MSLAETAGDPSRRLGATAALLAMIKIERIAENLTGADDKTLRLADEAIKAMTSAAGPLSPFQAGFIEALAEALYTHATAGAPDLLVWMPKAAKSDSELANDFKNLEALYAGSLTGLARLPV